MTGRTIGRKLAERRALCASSLPITSVSMFNAALLAFADVTSPAFRGVLIKSLLLTVALFAALLIGLEAALPHLAETGFAWADVLIGLVAALGLLAGFVFLLAPVTALFAGLYLDRIASIVEARHYPEDPPGRDLAMATALVMGLKFAIILLLVTLASLPLLFIGFGALILVAANARLISREYVEMIARRHMPAEEARLLRMENGPKLFVAGLLPALLALVPLANLFLPLFCTAYFTHITKGLKRL